jgi:hypothetical protein
MINHNPYESKCTTYDATIYVHNNHTGTHRQVQFKTTELPNAKRKIKSEEIKIMHKYN